MSVRLSGDGPSSWVVYLNVARPRSKEWSAWGALNGAYPDDGLIDDWVEWLDPSVYVVGRDPGHIGGKPYRLMRSIVDDYSRPGDLVCDPCAGMATTLIAARALGRNGVGAEIDPDTHARAIARLEGWSAPGDGVQLDLLKGAV